MTDNEKLLKYLRNISGTATFLRVYLWIGVVVVVLTILVRVFS